MLSRTCGPAPSRLMDQAGACYQQLRPWLDLPSFEMFGTSYWNTLSIPLLRLSEGNPASRWTLNILREQLRRLSSPGAPSSDCAMGCAQFNRWRPYRTMVIVCDAGSARVIGFCKDQRGGALENWHRNCTGTVTMGYSTVPSASKIPTETTTKDGRWRAAIFRAFANRRLQPLRPRPRRHQAI